MSFYAYEENWHMKEQSTADTNELENKLQNWLSDACSVAIAGIGNPLRTDDFVGVKIVRNLRGKVTPRVYLLECETVPESFLRPITRFKPTHVLLIDAGILNQKPGTSKLIDSDHIRTETAISTHALPLRIFCEYLAKTIHAKIALLLIQPKDTSFGEGLTAELQQAEKHLTNLLSEFLP